MGQETTSRYTINSILRANAVLRCLARENAPMRVGEIAKRLDLDRTTAFRLIVTLEQCAFVERVPGGKEYKLGVGVFEVGSAYLRGTDLYSVARPVMIELSQRIKESVHWAILANDKAVCIDKIDSPRGLGTTSKIGRAVSLNSGSVGKVLLAYQPEETREQILKTISLPKLTERTIVTPADMRAEIESIFERGYCLSLGEGESDMACIAAPIFNHNHQILAGLSIGGPIHRFADEETAAELIEALREAAWMISEKMGCTEKPPVGHAV